MKVLVRIEFEYDLDDEDLETIGRDKLLAGDSEYISEVIMREFAIALPHRVTLEVVRDE